MPWNPNIVAVVQVPILGELETVTIEIGGESVEVTQRPVTGYQDGVHLNIPASFVTPAMEEYLVEPETPVAVIAGVETAFLHFDDEEQAREVCPHLWLEPAPEPAE